MLGGASFLLVMSGLVALVVIGLGIYAGHLRRQRDALLETKDVVYNFVQDIGEVFAGTDAVDLDALLRRVLHHALRTTRAGAGAVFLAEPDGKHLRAVAVSGVFPPMAPEIDEGINTAYSQIRYAERLVRRQRVVPGEGPIGEVMSLGKALLIEDAERDPRVPQYEARFLRVRSLLAVPMRFRSRVLGVLAVVNRVDRLPFLEANQGLLQALADQASVPVNYAAVSAALEEKRRLDYDLGVARRIQRALLPRRIPDTPGVELAAFSVPAQQIGGDYYDFVQVDDENLGIVIADVSGKGVSAAIVMSICRSVLRIKAPGRLNPAALLSEVNRTLTADLAEDMFVSLLYMIFNTRTHELTLARAGHVYPVLNRGRDGQPVAIKSGGMAIGLASAEAFDRALEERVVKVRPGDTIVAYTDGVTEAHDRAGNEWGVLNLYRTIQRTSFQGKGAEDLAGDVQQKLLQFVGDMSQYDDMTLVALKAAGTTKQAAQEQIGV